MSFSIPPDILIAGGLVLLVLVILLVSRMQFFPRKSLPFIAAAIGAAFGFALFKKARASASLKKIAELEELLKEKEKKLADLKADAAESRRQADEAMGQLQDAIAAAQKELLLIRARDKAQKDEVLALSNDGAFERFSQSYGDR